MGLDITTLIKILSITITVAIIGSIVGVNMICHMEGVNLEKCKSKILFIVERLTFSIFNTLILGFGFLGFLYYKQLNIQLESVYFMVFLAAVLITSAMSFEVTKIIVSISKRRLEKEGKKIAGDD